MPAIYLMSWEPKNRRWWGTITGHPRLFISCRQLAKWSGKQFPPTMDGSYQVANEWYRVKERELLGEKPSHRYAKDLEELEKRRAWAIRNGSHDMAKVITHELQLIHAGSEPSYLSQYQDDDNGRQEGHFPKPNFRVAERGDPEYEEKLARGFIDEVDAWDATDVGNRVWNDRVGRGVTQPVAEDLYVRSRIKSYLDGLRGRVGAGQFSPGSYANKSETLKKFEKWIGEDALVDSIDEETLHRYFQHILGLITARNDDLKDKSGCSVAYAKKQFSDAKTFIFNLVEKKLVPPLASLSSKAFRLNDDPKKIIPYTIEEVRVLVERATGQLKLHLLLMLNCGMTQIDIANLQDEEVDWDRGRIVRKRSKTQRLPNTPTVSYNLWPTTLDLLKLYRSGQDRVLQTCTGGRWAWREMGANGKTRRSDNIATNYNRLRKKTGIDKTLIVMKKTSSSLLRTQNEYADLYWLFLGHSPKTIADRHYAAPPEERLNAAITWLGKTYGFVK
jgi:integrase